MIKSADYVLSVIAEKYYILPVAQNIADLGKSLKINSTGALIWELLDAYSSVEEISKAIIQKSDMNPGSFDEVSADVTAFINQLERAGILKFVPSCYRFDALECNQDLAYELNIGTIPINIYGNKDLLSERFQDFLAGRNHGNPIELSKRFPCEIYISHEKDPDLDSPRTVFTTPEITVKEGYDFFKIEFDYNDRLDACYIKADGRAAIIYCNENVGKDPLFNALQFIFSYMALKQDLIFIHSASVFHNEKGHIFSAASGVGKSTHTNLWKKVLNAKPLNGDLNLLGIINEKAYILPTPWCGTSDIYTNDIYPLSSITLLNQSVDNKVKELSFDNKVFLSLQRSISPKWNEYMLKKQISVLEKIATKTTITKYNCNMDETAVTTIYDYLDKHTEN